MSGLYKLKSFEELMDEINMGMDIEFLLYGVRYNISWRDEKPFICICPDGRAVFFDDPDMMFNQYKAAGRPLKEIWQDFEIIAM